MVNTVAKQNSDRTGKKDPTLLAVAIQKYNAGLPLSIAESCALVPFSRALLYQKAREGNIQLRDCEGRTVIDPPNLRALLGQPAA
jgi:hypothetical protein